MKKNNDDLPPMSAAERADLERKLPYPGKLNHRISGYTVNIDARDLLRLLGLREERWEVKGTQWMLDGVRLYVEEV